MSAHGRGATGGGHCGRTPPPAFHTLANDMSLDKGGTHFTLKTKAMY